MVFAIDVGGASGQQRCPRQQPTPPAGLGAGLPETIRELRRSGLTVDDIAVLFGVHPKAVAGMLRAKPIERRADN